MGVRETAGLDTRLGDGQTIQDMTASRAFGVAYTNTTGKSIVVSVSGQGDAASYRTMLMQVDGVAVERVTVGVAATVLLCAVRAVVPNGSTYAVSVTSGTALTGWAELR